MIKEIKMGDKMTSTTQNQELSEMAMDNCSYCTHREKIVDGSNYTISGIMMCMNKKSDHYCHILFDDHPSCDEFKPR